MGPLVDIFRLIRDVRRNMPRSIDVWGGLLNIPQIVGGLAFIVYWQGAAVLAVWFAAMTVCGQVHRVMPFSRLIGVGHALWLPLMPFLLIRALAGASPDGGGYEQAFVIWLWYTFVTMTISVIFDAVDFWRYVTSDQKQLALRVGTRNA